MEFNNILAKIHDKNNLGHKSRIHSGAKGNFPLARHSRLFPIILTVWFSNNCWGNKREYEMY